jgi:hypothetical protein
VRGYLHPSAAQGASDTYGWVDTKAVLDVLEKRKTLFLPVIEPILPHFGSIPNRWY